MKSVIVLFYPENIELPEDETVLRDCERILKDYNVIFLTDKNRTKIEVEVFFNSSWTP